MDTLFQIVPLAFLSFGAFFAFCSATKQQAERHARYVLVREHTAHSTDTHLN